MHSERLKSRNYYRKTEKRPDRYSASCVDATVHSFWKRAASAGSGDIKKKRTGTCWRAPVFFRYTNPINLPGMCSVQLEIAEMLCKSFFESQHRTILHTFSSGRLLLANQAVQFTEMFFFLPFFCLEKKIHLTYDICGDLSADFFF